MSVTDFGSAWRGTKVAITGASGFKGAWLCHWLLRQGAEIMGYSLPPPTEPSLFELTRLDESIERIDGDIRDLDKLKRELHRFQPSIVFHLAAETLVLESYDRPVETFGTNVMGTVNVLEAARTADDLRACVVVTSDKCYENLESKRGYREGDAMGGSDPYSASKGCAELVTAAYRRSFFETGDTRVASARAGNVIAGGDWARDRLIPDIVRALTDQRPLRLRMPEAVRPWQHVLDPLSGYIVLAEQLLGNGGLASGWNFGPDPDHVWTVHEVVAEFYRHWEIDSSPHIELADSERRETSYLALDASKAHKLLSWQPVWGVKDAVERTARWYSRLYRGGENPDYLVDEELGAYWGALGSPQRS